MTQLPRLPRATSTTVIRLSTLKTLHQIVVLNLTVSLASLILVAWRVL